MTWTNANDVLEQANIMVCIDSVHGIVKNKYMMMFSENQNVILLLYCK